MVSNNRITTNSFSILILFPRKWVTMGYNGVQGVTTGYKISNKEKVKLLSTFVFDFDSFSAEMGYNIFLDSFHKLVEFGTKG